MMEGSLCGSENHDRMESLHCPPPRCLGSKAVYFFLSSPIWVILEFIVSVVFCILSESLTQHIFTLVQFYVSGRGSGCRPLHLIYSHICYVKI